MAEFPFSDLLDAAGPGVSIHRLARDLGLPVRTVHRWHRTGAVPATSADRAAVALGHHPAEIWPTAWSGLDPADWSTDDDD